MLFEQAVFIGIDPTAGKRPMAYAAIDRDLRLMCLDQGDLNTVIAFARGQEQALVAVCGPPRPHQGLMEDPAVRSTLNPTPRPGRWTGYRVAEYLLNQHGIRVPRTRGQADRCPAWIQSSFELHRQLEAIGYHPYPRPKAPLQVLETYPHAVYTVLLEHRPYPKRSLEGRLQRQLLLYQLGLDIPDPMRIFEEITRHRILQGMLSLDDLFAPAVLDALVAAYTAWTAANQTKKITLLGNPIEGQIALPVRNLKPRYR